MEVLFPPAGKFFVFISLTEKIAILPLKAEVPDLSDREAVAKFIELHLE